MKFSREPLRAIKIYGRALTLTVIASALLSLAANGQDQRKIDSLQIVLNKVDDSVRLDLLQEIVLQYADVNDSIAYIFSVRADLLARQLPDSFQIVKTSVMKAQILRRLGRTEESLTLFKTLLPIAKRNNYSQSLKYTLTGLVLNNILIANYDEALEYGLECLLLLEKLDDNAGIGTALLNIGLIHYKMKNYARAIQYYSRSLEIMEKIGDYYNSAKVRINIGLCYSYLNSPYKAEEYFDQGFKSCKSSCDDIIAINGEFGYGVAKFYQRKWKEAQDHFYKSYSLAMENGYHRFESENLLFLGRIEFEQKNFSKANEYFLKCEKIAALSSYNLLMMDSYFELAKLHKEINNLGIASLFQEKYIQLRNTIFNEDVINKIIGIQTKFDQHQNSMIITSKEKTIQIQKYRNMLLLLMIVSLVIIVFLLKKRIRKWQKLNNRLDVLIQNRTAELKSNQSTLSRAYSDQNILFTNTIKILRGSLATMKGLYRAAILDGSDEMAKEYLRKNLLVTDDLGVTIERLLLIKNLNVRSYEKFDLQHLFHKAINGANNKFPRLSVSASLENGLTLVTDQMSFILLIDTILRQAQHSNTSILFKARNENALTLIEVKIAYPDNIDYSILKELAAYSGAELSREDIGNRSFILGYGN